MDSKALLPLWKLDEIQPAPSRSLSRFARSRCTVPEFSETSPVSGLEIPLHSEWLLADTSCTRSTPLHLCTSRPYYFLVPIPYEKSYLTIPEPGRDERRQGQRQHERLGRLVRGRAVRQTDRDRAVRSARPAPHLRQALPEEWRRPGTDQVTPGTQLHPNHGTLSWVRAGTRRGGQ
jgi:hypothetical protein